MPEKWNEVESKWDAVYQYRASIIIDKKAFAALIWGQDIPKAMHRQ